MNDVVKQTLLARVYDVAVETPLEKADLLSRQIGCSIYIKREDLQPIHSFKIRGAYNKIVQLHDAPFIFLLRRDARASLFGLLTGSSLIFLGLYALLYGVNTGLLFILTTDELIEIGIKVYCLSVGSFFIIYFWKLAKELLVR